MILQASGLTKRYGDFTALKDCTFEIDRGEVLGLLGPNGSGKTTLIRLLLGFLKPTLGNAKIEGLDCYRQSVEVHRRLSYIPGDPRMARKLTGEKWLRFFARLHSASSQDAAMKMAERLELNYKRPIKQMSTGMRQKLALAATLAPDVPLVILDEPTSNLDPTARNQVLTLIREAQSNGKTVLFSSHVLSEVEEVCDRVIMLRQGTLVDNQQMAKVRQSHRIHVLLNGKFTLPPEELAKDLEVKQDGNNSVTLQTASPLAPLLGWLSNQPLEDIKIESMGLRAIYEKHHGANTA